jgi:soluble lytic murein transglycosylase
MKLVRSVLTLSAALLAAPSAQADVERLPAVSAGLDASQVAWYTRALADNERGKFSTDAVNPAAAPKPDMLAEKLVQWDRLRRENYKAGFAEVGRFLSASPDWPLERQMRVKAESALLATPTGLGDTMQERVTFFDRFAPITSSGKLRYAEALTSAGRSPQAQPVIRDAWRSGGLGASDESIVLTNYSAWLTALDHAARMNQLLWNNQTSSAQRLIGLVPEDVRALAAARLAYKSDSPAAEQLYELVPAVLKRDAGLVLDRGNWLKRSKGDAAARSWYLQADVDPATVLKPTVWVRERRRLSAQALEAGELNTAYTLLATHRMAENYVDLSEASEDDRIAFVEAEWTAGWIALRYLRKPQDAFTHFRNMQFAAKTPITQARAAYWAGRAADSMNNGPLAQQWYGLAAQHQDYFYGQLASDKLGKAVFAPDMTQPKINTADLQAYANREPVRAARLLGELGDLEGQTQFISLLAQRATTVEEKRIAADLAREINRLDLGVRIGKLTRAKGLSLGYASYPRFALPADMARVWTYVHAITRQESLFNTRAVSRAGARGMMQLMPGTARETSGKLGLPYDFARLTSDPTYNMMLGSTYFARLLDSYGGNYVLAVAAYNAGPGNVRKWLAINGDPREPSVDVIDWIEQIPFSETRNYVQRVLENAVVYKLIEPGRKDSQGFNVLSELLGKAKSTS